MMQEDAGGMQGMLRMQEDAGGMQGVQGDAGGTGGCWGDAGDAPSPAPCLPLAAGVNQQQCQLCRLFGIV